MQAKVKNSFRFGFKLNTALSVALPEKLWHQLLNKRLQTGNNIVNIKASDIRQQVGWTRDFGARLCWW
ncbi:MULTISPECIES: hypothetical protein [Marisediminitalea]|jgi:hypothetical protein|uniref:hypothetical protein n=1 Tax=Marisediminitalea TaxID=2662254 RepID=UPI0020CC74A4|nr:hypothetical protein [Marisediminitalea aggregata]MCP3863029.1 hypothetical protein [Aestuariibacter sp.]MCP4234651.1 hypothetical protein [Aestuariibacter sp.]MCP4526618.1 hypothetical protein [Aestuariibacter sp.]MCP4949221.1 hypothetical protein [Aestuariibacter sp.]MCP5012006.1 hypothetical protein [Aestuariibacter sp.]